MGSYLPLLCLTAVLFSASANPAPPTNGVVDVVILNPQRYPSGLQPAGANIRDTGEETTTTETPTTVASSQSGESGANTKSDEIHCKQESNGDNSFFWSSPNFGSGNYPNDANCKVSSSSTKPGYATVSFNNLNILCEGRGDHITFKQPYHIDDIAGKKYCGVMTESGAISTTLPTYNFIGQFRSDHSGTSSGFNVTITQGTTKCHKIIDTTVAEETTGIIQTPSEPNAGSTKICEWWIKAPVGKKVEMLFIDALTQSPTCDEGRILVDRTGSKHYRRTMTNSYCGSDNPGTIISKKNLMSILYYSNDNKDHFTARWSLVKAY